MNKILFKIALWKRYFDEGFSFINYLKYFLMVGAGTAVLSKVNMGLIFMLLTAYFIFCFILGWWICNYGFLDCMTEVSNRFNPFVKQVRKKFGITNKRNI